MIFTGPIPFAEAMRSRKVKALMPTTLSSRELSRLSNDLRERAVFSAKVTNAQFLQRMDDLITQIVGGATPEREAARAAGDAALLVDPAEAKAKLKEFLRSTDYVPNPDEAGTIQDLTSDARLNIVVDTNVATAQGFGQWLNGQTATKLDLWPAQELVRIQPSAKERPWMARWKTAGGKFYGGTRMIARKDDPIWSKLGDPKLFSDGLGNPYPPFAFNSGMDVRNISRKEAISLGVIQADDPSPKPDDRGFNEDLQVQADRFSQALSKALDADPDLQVKGGVVTLA